VAVTVIVEGLADLQKYLDALPDVTRTAARIALNTGADFGVAKLLPEELEKQVAFPVGYLNPSRLFVSERARDDSLEAAITGRQTPTSLARFAGAATFGQKGGVTVTVRPGAPRKLERAFLVRLRQGTRSTAQGFNTGLAVRVRPGETLRGSTAAVQLDNNVFILYGPSVDQVLRTVADDQTDAIAEKVRSEFFRQFARLSGDL
jgi:hypothetical protein